MPGLFVCHDLASICASYRTISMRLVWLYMVDSIFRTDQGNYSIIWNSSGHSKNDGQTDGWTDGQADGQADGWTDGWTDGWMQKAGLITRLVGGSAEEWNIPI